MHCAGLRSKRKTTYHKYMIVLSAVYIYHQKARDYSTIVFKDVRAHCYCASLVRTLYMKWRVPRHVFQACTLSRNSTKYRAGDLCGNLICEYFCWMLSNPHFFRQITSFSDSFHYTKKQKNLYMGSSNRVDLVHGYRCARLRSCLF